MDRREKRALVRMHFGCKAMRRPKGVAARTIGRLRAAGMVGVVTGLTVGKSDALMLSPRLSLSSHGAREAIRLREARDGVAGLVRA